MKKHNLTAQIIELDRPKPFRVIAQSEKESVPSTLDRTLVVICAYNEEITISRAIESLKPIDILVIDDGSSDKTREIALSEGATVISHKSRMGKAASLADGVAYALQNNYEIVVEIGADAITEHTSLRKLLRHFKRPEVGGVSCRQIPVGTPNIAYYIDEVIWAILAEGKKLQMRSKGSSHLGAVFFAFRPDLVDSVIGCVNDDEKVGLSITQRRYKTIFEDLAVAYFDASSCVGHILQRRRRMYYGHMRFGESVAPSMQVSTSVLALVNSIRKKIQRLPWVFPALALELYSRLVAWRDVRKTGGSERYNRWVTTYEKSSSTVLQKTPCL
jgi:cellulose synthase/poly-beta-1,6-N-acetylglucosamine synthase-like glycosyltransferase